MTVNGCPCSSGMRSGSTSPSSCSRSSPADFWRTTSHSRSRVGGAVWLVAGSTSSRTVRRLAGGSQTLPAVATVEIRPRTVRFGGLLPWPLGCVRRSRGLGDRRRGAVTTPAVWRRGRGEPAGPVNSRRLALHCLPLSWTLSTKWLFATFSPAWSLLARRAAAQSRLRWRGAQVGSSVRVSYSRVGSVARRHRAVVVGELSAEADLVSLVVGLLLPEHADRRVLGEIVGGAVLSLALILLPLTPERCVIERGSDSAVTRAAASATRSQPAVALAFGAFSSARRLARSFDRARNRELLGGAAETLLVLRRGVVMAAVVDQPTEAAVAGCRGIAPAASGVARRRWRSARWDDGLSTGRPRRLARRGCRRRLPVRPRPGDATPPNERP